jgi:hypothetical protein
VQPELLRNIRKRKADLDFLPAPFLCLVRLGGVPLGSSQIFGDTVSKVMRQTRRFELIGRIGGDKEPTSGVHVLPVSLAFLVYRPPWNANMYFGRCGMRFDICKLHFVLGLSICRGAMVTSRSRCRQKLRLQCQSPLVVTVAADSIETLRLSLGISDVYLLTSDSCVAS